MTQEKKLVRKLSGVMAEVKYIQKRGFNKFHKYSYATESDVAEKVREELAKHSVMMIPSVLNHSTKEHTNRSGNVEYIVTVDMEFRFLDGETGEEITFRMSGQGQDAGDKGIYKAMTGAQKYALMKAFMIPTGDDPEADEGVDERNAQGQQQKPQGQAPQAGNGAASEKQVKAIHAIASEVAKARGVTSEMVEGQVKQRLGVESFKGISKQQASQAIEMLNGWKAPQNA